jgi:hypothetical protein
MNVKRIERFTKQTIPVGVVEGFEPKRSAPARTGARPGWKPGDGGRSAKPGQRSFQKPGAPAAGAREGGFRTDSAVRTEGGYRNDGQRREGGYRNDNGPRRERSSLGAHPRSSDSSRRSFGDR